MVNSNHFAYFEVSLAHKPIYNLLRNPVKRSFAYQGVVLLDMGHYLTAHSIEVTKTQSHKDTLSPRQIQSHQNYAKQVSELRGLTNNSVTSRHG